MSWNFVSKFTKRSEKVKKCLTVYATCERKRFYSFALMPNQRSITKKQLSVWVQDINEIDEHCKKTGQNRTQVIQELINELKNKRKGISK